MATDRALLIRDIEEAWRKRALIEPRGFDSVRRRRELAAEVDEYLEDLFALMQTAELEAAL